MDKQQEPRLRFKGFSGAWEEKKIGEIFNVTSGTTPLRSNQNYFSNGVINWVKTTDLNNSILDKTEEKISEIALNETSLKVLPKNTLFVAMYGGFNQIGRTGLLNMEATCNQALAAILPDKSQNPFYLLTYLNYSVEYWKGIAASSRKDPNITKQDVLDFECFFPSLPEQTHLSLFFRRLDSQIAESCAVLEKSRQLKKAMLTKMFPANGEKIPKIRFKGFEGEWERKKLGEIAFKVKEKNIAYQYAETFTNSAEFGIISQQDFFDKSISNSENIGGYYVVQPDDFVYNPRISSFAPVGPIKRNKLGRTGVMSPLYYVFRLNDEIKPSYLEQYFEGNQWHHFMYLNGDTGARSDRFSIKNDVFAEMPISFPANKNEQTKIGNFFRQLDETIALQSEEVEKLNQLKKGLLAAMLV